MKQHNLLIFAFYTLNEKIVTNIFARREENQFSPFLSPAVELSPLSFDSLKMIQHWTLIKKTNEHNWPNHKCLG